MFSEDRTAAGDKTERALSEQACSLLVFARKNPGSPEGIDGGKSICYNDKLKDFRDFYFHFGGYIYENEKNEEPRQPYGALC